ncbi:MAG: TIGR00266 family protein [Tissierellia bacterium]|mgnify:CR=1 FL=1|nr:TIGR00266 family protein [Tissierellia bacterium]
MEYEIKGDNLPVVICKLNSGEKMVSQAGAMGWMTDNIIMDTNMKGGLMGGIGRMFSGESLFLNTFTSSRGPGTIAFPSSFPGKILALELKAGESVIAQKDAFLASEESVSLEVHFKKKLAAGLFGGEGFILQKITGPGIVFLEMDGHIEEYDLQPGEVVKVDTGHVAMFEQSVSFDIETIKGMKNVLFGGEGLFLTTLTGPGKVYLQTMPIQNLAGQISRLIPSKAD